MSSDSIHVHPIQRETLLRLRAEVRLASTHLDLARERLERAMAEVARTHGVDGALDYDFNNGLIQARGTDAESQPEG